MKNKLSVQHIVLFMSSLAILSTIFFYQRYTDLRLYKQVTNEHQIDAVRRELSGIGQHSRVFLKYSDANDVTNAQIELGLLSSRLRMLENNINFYLDALLYRGDPHQLRTRLGYLALYIRGVQDIRTVYEHDAVDVVTV